MMNVYTAGGSGRWD